MSPTGYGSTSDRIANVREVFRPFVRDLFPSEWAYTMLAVVFPNGSIPPHKDGPLKIGFKRYHLILQTNEHSWNMHDGEWQQFEEGGVYTMECTDTHAAVNWGAEPRIHLVIDTDEISL